MNVVCMTLHEFLYVARGCNSPTVITETDRQRVKSGSLIDPSKAICRDVAHANNLKTKEMHAPRNLKRLPASILSPLNQL